MIEVDGIIQAMLITHVDDLCWAVKPGYEGCMTKILEKFVVEKVQQRKF